MYRLNKNCNGVEGVIFKQHSGHYFKTGVDKTGDGRSIVRVGAIQHGTYDDKKCYSVGDDVTYWADERCDHVMWDATKTNSLYKISSFTDPPKYKGVPQTWLTTYDQKKDFDEIYANIDHKHKKWGREFVTKVMKLEKGSWCNASACVGQSKTGLATQGCKRASCLNGDGYTDLTKDNPFRCVLGCGDGWKAIGKIQCKKRGNLVKYKDRTTKGRHDPKVLEFVNK